MQRLLSPTPARFHYLFSLRDLSRVYEGLLQSARGAFGKPALLKLWRNEFARVFCDRLICQGDRDIVEQHLTADLTTLVTESSTTSSEDFSTALEAALVFGDFRELPKLLEDY